MCYQHHHVLERGGVCCEHVRFDWLGMGFDAVLDVEQREVEGVDGQGQDAIQESWRVEISRHPALVVHEPVGAMESEKKQWS